MKKITTACTDHVVKFLCLASYSTRATDRVQRETIAERRITN